MITQIRAARKACNRPICGTLVLACRVTESPSPARACGQPCRRPSRLRVPLLGAVVIAALVAARAHSGAPMPAIAMHGDAGRPVDFSHFAYADPDAPKGGRLTQAIVGTFDSLNPFIIKGLPVDQVRGYVIESLMARDYDAPFTLDGLLARTIETDAARDYVEFALDPAATFSDDVPVTAADVIFSWQLLRDHGRPNLRTYYKKVVRAEAVDQRTVRFDLVGASDRELPLILGLMPILPRHAVDPLGFEEALGPLAVRTPRRAVDGQLGHERVRGERRGDEVCTLTCNTNRANRMPGSGSARAPRPWPSRRPCTWSRDRSWVPLVACRNRIAGSGRRVRRCRFRACGRR